VEQEGNVAATLLFEIQKALSEYFRATTAVLLRRINRWRGPET
jgi:hypothetical protein